ncbi:N-acetylglucosamine-6-phosphate deacetylase [Kutzneria viridogrisea]|uniref:N-acetylglucosamine-6-phosphate deacetylase n=2 Tax=Kutzneria TaxID=43356 RepID=W5W6M6_9PSEU|nr:N-acetylglucosamine-6-phosphate deacetylase [Kutzneria albida]AHH93859.1 N-acetylglucosamine-6-phosphate deacetylase [Kutzneria albida DSM 43870]MBA8931136.1 N-acetylglucosamine-6-phosphate deacetylase [Kutzneria viridogrisea]
MEAVVAAPRALVGRALTGPVSVRVRDGRIVEVVEGRAADAEVLPTGLLTAGLVDVQINGAFGVDFADVDAAGMRAVAGFLPRTGVTRFLPTLITAPVPAIVRQSRALVAAMAALPEHYGARPVGLHLEGPFLSPQRHGVHDPDLMVAPGTDNLDLILRDRAVAEALRIVTLAPERPGGTEAIRRLVEAGVVVSVGHSDATAAQTTAAADAGASMVTHLFNAQTPLSHREPGVPGIALTDHRYTLGLIADLAHVAGPVCRLVFAAAGERVMLVTDAVAAAGMPAGRYRLGGAEVLLTEAGVPRSPEGTIAGSALTLDRAVRNIVSLGVAEADALTSATEIPADAIGAKDLGRIAPGAVADLVWWDEDLRPRRVWVDGEVVYDADEVGGLVAAGS